jgi:heterodisulfide reductase subunit C
MKYHAFKNGCLHDEFSPQRKEKYLMPITMTPPPAQATIHRPDARFSKEVIERSGVNLNLCWSCRSCAGGCPFYHAMDYGPNRLIRDPARSVEGKLESRTIWLCVGATPAPYSVRTQSMSPP